MRPFHVIREAERRALTTRISPDSGLSRARNSISLTSSRVFQCITPREATTPIDVMSLVAKPASAIIVRMPNNVIGVMWPSTR